MGRWGDWETGETGEKRRVLAKISVIRKISVPFTANKLKFQIAAGNFHLQQKILRGRGKLSFRVLDMFLYFDWA
jgi:hypothetical protein